MIKGEIKMVFDDVGAHVDTSILSDNGIVDMCFIIDALCKALKLKGRERTVALAAVAAVGDEETEE